MSDFKGKINEIIVGDDYDVVRTISDLPSGETVSEAWFTVKENHWDTTTIVDVHITTTYSAQYGGITDTGSGDAEAEMIFHLRGGVTDNFSPYFKYIYSIRVKTPSGKYYSPELGDLVALPNVNE